jgi:hypothetical protein
VGKKKLVLACVSCSVLCNKKRNSYVRQKSRLQERVKVQPFERKWFGIYEYYLRMAPVTVF